MMKQQTRAYLLAALAIAFWSTVAAAFKLTLRYIDPLPLILYASITSAVILFLIAFLQGKLGELKAFSAKYYFVCFILGLLNPSLYYFVLFSAYDALPAQQAMTINYSWPIMLVLLSIFFLRQNVRPLELLAISIAYLGVVVIATGGQLAQWDIGETISNPTGVIFALLSTVIWAVYWLVSVRFQQDTVLTLLVSFSIAIPVLGLLTFSYSSNAFLSLPNLNALMGAVYIGVFEMGITFVLWSTALKLSESTAKVSGLIFITPFLSLLFIALFVGEQISAATLVGLAIVMAGIMLQKVAHFRQASHDK